MKAGIWCGTLIATLLTVSAFAQKPPQSDTPTQSEKRSGPGGLEGWTLEGPLPDDPAQNYPFALVIARNGLVIRKIDGDPFVWKWMFLANGRQVAYESGPLHFSLTCILADIQTGRILKSYDCFRELPESAPEWVKRLEANP